MFFLISTGASVSLVLDSQSLSGVLRPVLDLSQILQEKALAKYGSIADEIVDQEQNPGQFLFVQVAQVLVDSGNQNSLL